MLAGLGGFFDVEGGDDLSAFLDMGFVNPESFGEGEGDGAAGGLLKKNQGFWGSMGVGDGVGKLEGFANLDFGFDAARGVEEGVGETEGLDDLVLRLGAVMIGMGRRTSSRTLARPFLKVPSFFAASTLRSIMRPFTNGPRLLILTMMDLSDFRSTTRTYVLKGIFLWAAVKSSARYRSPLAVRRPIHFPPYQEATPTSTDTGLGAKICISVVEFADGGTERMLWQPDRMKRTRIPKSGRR